MLQRHIAKSLNKEAESNRCVDNLIIQCMNRTRVEINRDHIFFAGVCRSYLFCERLRTVAVKNPSRKKAWYMNAISKKVELVIKY